MGSTHERIPNINFVKVRNLKFKYEEALGKTVVSVSMGNIEFHSVNPPYELPNRRFKDAVVKLTPGGIFIGFFGFTF